MASPLVSEVPVGHIAGALARAQIDAQLARIENEQLRIEIMRHRLEVDRLRGLLDGHPATEERGGLSPSPGASRCEE